MIFNDQIKGIVMLIGGIYCLFIAYNIPPWKLKNAERYRAWQEKYGGVMKILAPIIIISGILLLFGFFD